MSLLVALGFIGAPSTAAAQNFHLAWDQSSISNVTGFAVSVDGVRTDYGLSPKAADGSCGCSITLPFTSGTHKLIVIAYNSAGETASAPLSIDPTANAGGPYSGQAGTPISVSAAGTTDAAGVAISSYRWNWGDGTSATTSSSSTANHTYTGAGTYTISLTVTDQFGATGTATTTASIAAAATATPGAPGSPSPSTGATGVSTAPTLSWTASGATSYDVRFGTSSSPPLVASGRTAASYAPGTLSEGTRYYWQITAKNTAGSTTGSTWSFTTASAQSSGEGDIVIHASAIGASQLHGTWKQASDSASPSGIKLSTPDNGFATTSSPLASPTHYIDVPFDAPAGVPYTLWLRLRATSDSKWNDSVWVQFSDARVTGSSAYDLNSTRGLLVNLAPSNAASTLSGWGWQNGAYWLSQSATVTFAGSGTHTLRIQVREDGVELDQIVLSSSTYLNASPGSLADDTTIVNSTSSSGPPTMQGSPSPANGATSVSSAPTLSWSASGASSYDVQFGTTNPPPAAGTVTSASFSPGSLAAGTTYYWRVIARNSSGSTTGPVWSFTTASGSSSGGSSDIVIYASDVGSLHGAWSKTSSSTSPNGVKLTTPDWGFSATSAPATSPTHYFDVTFDAPSGTPYTIWLRLRATGGSKYADSVWVQFSDARIGWSTVYQTGTQNGLLVNLASDWTGSSLSGWGWGHGAYWLSQPATVTFANSGSHTLRIQVREDGVELDQIVLSPARYLTAPPGPASNDSTIVQK